MYNFRSLSKIPYDFLKFNFPHFTPQVRLFLVEKGNLRFLESKMPCRADKKNYHFRKTLNCNQNFRENNVKVVSVIFEKTQVSLG